MESDGSKVKVLYISGFERSGSTLLTKALGELDDTFAAGELRAIWWTSYLKNQTCGCGQPFRDCPVWTEVTERVFGGFDHVDFEWMTNHRPRRRHTPLLLTAAGRPIVARHFAHYIRTLDRLYTSIAEVTESRIIVDESKTPLYGSLLGLVPSIDLYVVHLIRDPRGIYCSNLRRKRRGDQQLQRYNAVSGTALWNVLNASQELLGRSSATRYLQLRYEDFIANPSGSIERIKTMLDEQYIGMPKFQDGHVELGNNHIMSGNRNRMETGSVLLRSPDTWRSEIDRRGLAAVTYLALPLLHRYGYS